jgi:hypothetical protein
MILRRYGSSLQSVDLNFDSKALTEIGFRKNGAHAEPADDFATAWERVRGHELAATSEGSVQDEVERDLLKDLEGQIRKLEGELGADDVLVVESEQGTDYPKTRTQTRTVVVGGGNRLRFTTTVHPPLRVGIYRKRGASG